MTLTAAAHFAGLLERRIAKTSGTHHPTMAIDE